MFKILLTIYIFIASVAFSAEEAGITLLQKKKEKVIKTVTKKIIQLDISKIEKQNDELKKLLEMRSSMPVIWDGSRKILTGKTLKGRLLNSIVSTNLESPVLVEAYGGQGLPPETKFSCVGSTKHKRVITICNKLVTKSKEIPVNVQILNMDGTAGLLGEYEDGKDELITGIVVTNAAQGILAASQDYASSTTGNIPSLSLKNQLISGAMNSAKATSDILTEDLKTREPIVSIDSGTEVLIYFQEAVNVY